MKLPDLRQSSLATTGHYSADLDHLRQRAEAAGYRLSDDGLCEGCDAGLTEADIEYGACTQCDAALEMIDD